MSARRFAAATAALVLTSAVGVGAVAEVAPVAHASVSHAAAPAGTAFTVTFVGSIDDSVPQSETTTTTGDPAPAPSSAEVPATPAGGAGGLGTDVLPQQTDLVCALSSLDLTTGVVTLLPATPSQDACAGDLAFAPDGTLYGLLGGGTRSEPISELVRFDTTTGAATVIGQIGTFSSNAGFSEVAFGGITFDRLGRLFVDLGNAESPNADPQCSVGDDITFCLYRIADPSQPQNVTFVGPTISDEYVSGLASSCDATYLEYTTGGLDSGLVGTLNLETGAPTELGVVSRNYLNGLDFDTSGRFLGIHSAGEDITLDTINTAGGSPINSTLVPITPAPEDQFIPEALAVAPLQCAIAAPITFTG